MSVSRSRAKAIALLLLGPLLLLQTFQASTLFCEGLAHASLLSVRCPHHQARTDAPRAGDGHSDQRAGDEHDDCICPFSGNELPDGLIKLALGGLGVPVQGAPTLLIPPATSADPEAGLPPHSDAIPRSLEHPPRLLS